MRIFGSSCLVCLLALPACASDANGIIPAGGAGSVGVAGATPAAGAGQSAGAPASGGAGPTAGGAPGAAGTPVTPRAGAGGGDDGDLFGPGSYVPYMPSGGAASIPGDGNVATANMDGGGVKGKAVFTQTGADVAVVVTLTSCPNGTHSITLQEGLSCDNESTIKGVWSRGQFADGGNSTIECSNNKGSLSYTRKGTSDKAWAITGVPDVDPSAHVVAVRSAADQNSSRLVCGNFF